MTTPQEDLIYEQTYTEFRSLNGFFWQIPLIMMTLNGGLWFSVASLDLDVTAERGILWFAAFANLTMAVGLWRLRAVMATLLVRIHSYENTPAPGPSNVIERLFQTLMCLAAIGALIASCHPKAHFIRPPTKPAEAGASTVSSVGSPAPAATSKASGAHGK